MTGKARTITAILSVAVVALTIGVAVAMAWDRGAGHMGARDDALMDMMDSTGRMDSDVMHQSMQEMPSHQTMLEHMPGHGAGAAMLPGDAADGMMQMMMGGMVHGMHGGHNHVSPIMPH